MVGEYWLISFPVRNFYGLVDEYTLNAENETEARDLARITSLHKGSANIFNKQGFVATYIRGRVWKINE